MKSTNLVKLIIGAIYSDSQLLEVAKKEMKRLKLITQNQSEEFPFDLTEYYAKEMGSKLKRRFLSIEGLLELKNFFEWKLKMVSIENKLRKFGKRRINLDPGYIDLHRVVLLSSKEAPQKIFLSEGIWADLILLKRKGGYVDLPWTFPDIRKGYYNEFFLQVLEKFKEEKKSRQRIN